MMMKAPVPHLLPEAIEMRFECSHVINARSEATKAVSVNPETADGACYKHLCKTLIIVRRRVRDKETGREEYPEQEQGSKHDVGMGRMSVFFHASRVVDTLSSNFKYEY